MDLIHCPHCNARIHLKANAQTSNGKNASAPQKKARDNETSVPVIDVDAVSKAKKRTNSKPIRKAQVDVADVVIDVDLARAKSDAPRELAIADQNDSNSKTSVNAEDLEAKTAESVEPDVTPAVDLLPPTFIVPESDSQSTSVVLPAADGGAQVVDSKVVHVRHGTKTITLTAMSPEEKARWRLIQNIAALTLAALMLATALWLML